VKPADGEPGPQVPAKLVEDVRAVDLAPVLRDALTRIIRREFKMIDGALKKHAADPQAVRTWLAAFEPQQRTHIAQVLQPFCEASASAGKPMQTDIARFIESHIAQTNRAIEQILQADAGDRDDARWAALNESDCIDQAAKQLSGEPK
jgi:HPt (histidine-containing phosphotransfer) domain-containing protein